MFVMVKRVLAPVLECMYVFRMVGCGDVCILVICDVL